MAVLKQVLAKALIGARHDDRPVAGLLDARVVAIKRTDPPCSTPSKLYKPWPGPHRHVRTWFVLENGKAVGVNEDPDTGRTFPVIDYEP